MLFWFSYFWSVLLICVICLFVRVSFCFLWKSLFFPAILVFLVQCSFNLCCSFQFLVLALHCCFDCFLFQDVPLCVCVCACVAACCLALFWITILDLLLLCILFSCCWFSFVFCFGMFYLLIFGYQSKTSLDKLEIWNPPKWKMQRKKKNFLTRAISTGVFTNSVFFFFACLQIVHFCWSTIEIEASSPRNKKCCALKTGPSIS